MRGSIRIRLAQDGSKRWDCIYRAAGKQRWKTFDTRKAADAFLAGTVSDLATGQYRLVQSAHMSDVFLRWEHALAADLAVQRVKRSTYRSYRTILRCHLAPFFGGYRSDELTEAILADWRAAQAQKIAAGTLAPKTFNTHVAVLKTILDWAASGAGRHAIGRNPIPSTRFRAKVDPSERPIVQGAEIARLWAATTGQDRVIVALGLFAGLRRSEIFGLCWSDIDWPHGRQRAVLHVNRAFVDRQLVTPKSEAGRRAVQLTTGLVAVLRQHVQQRPPTALEHGLAFVIRQESGRPLDPDNWANRVWPTIRAAAKLPAAITLHNLRHTFGSLLLADNAPVKHVSEQMGHANPMITLRTYQKVLRATTATATRRLHRHMPKDPTRQIQLVRKRG